MRILIYFLFLLLLCTPSFGQLSLAKRALKSQSKGDLEKCEMLLVKAEEKIPHLAAFHFASASLKFDSSYTNFNLDTAYSEVLKAKTGYATLDEKSMTQHLKLGIDLLEIDRLKKRIENAAFVRATDQNSEVGFIFYLENFKRTSFQELAIKKRDSLAYISAVEQNNYQAYQAFMNRYPEAIQFNEANERYEKLYFDKSTADGKLLSFKKFLRIHPTTPYRREAEKQIFEISTASNAPSDYQKFIREYPKSDWVKKAQRLLFHVSTDQLVIKSDSLENVWQLQQQVLIPILKNGEYGFINVKGDEVIPPFHKSLKKDLLCETLTTDFYIADEKVYSINQEVIYDRKINNVSDLGNGVLKIESKYGVKIWHKSGWPIYKDYIDDVKLLGDEFIAFEFNKKWGLMTYTGRLIIPPSYDNINKEGAFFLLRNDDQFDVANLKALASLADNNRINFQPLYSDYQLLDEGHIWLQTDYGETVFDRGLNEVVPYNQQEIIPIPEGLLVLKENEVSILDKNYKTQVSIDGNFIDRNESFMSIQEAQQIKILALDDPNQIIEADSVKLLGRYFIRLYRNDSSWLHFKNNSRVYMETDAVVSLLASAGSSQYLAIKNENSLEDDYFDEEGNKIFSGSYQNISPVGEEYFVFSENGMKGLLNSEGEQLLDPDYNAIANYDSGYISSLLEKKFGIVNDQLNVNIPNNYDQKIVPYNDSIFIAKKDGYFGLIDRNGDDITSFEFEEIRFWNDTTAIVKNNYLYYFYDITDNARLGDGFKSIKFIKSNKVENVMIALGPDGYGVYSSKSGETIAPTFNDIIPLPTQDSFIYFTEKHVEEAEFYVVLYYDQKGNVIYKSAYEEEDYLLIYCEQ